MNDKANLSWRHGVWRGACVAALCLIVFATRPAGICGNATRGSARESLPQIAGAGAQHVTFVREFSGPQDMPKGPPPVLNRSLDIILGPAEPNPRQGEKMSRPYSVATDSAHRIYVTDPSEGLVHIFDFEKSEYSFLGGPGSELRSPVGLAIDADDRVYVTDSVLGLILVYASNGKFLQYLGRVEGGEPYFESPSGIAIERGTNHIYVCDAPRHMVILLDKQGHILGHFGKRLGGKGPGAFRYPTRISIAGQELVVLDSGNSRLQILDFDGHYRREIKIPELSFETGLALDAQKKIYVGNLTLDSIDVFTYDGQFLYRFGGIGAEPGEFNHPCGIWIDSANNVYVTDMRNERVEMFQIKGMS